MAIHKRSTIKIRYQGERKKEKWLIQAKKSDNKGIHEPKTDENMTCFKAE